MKKFSENDKLYQYWRQGIDAYTAWQPAALVDRYYYENVQWSEDEEAELKKINQPMITVNHIFPKINMLTGLLLQNRPSIHCFPRGKDDAEVAATATKVVKYIFDINNLQTRQLEAFTDMATAGIGWLEARASSLAGRDPLVIDYVPWQEMVTDPLSRQPDYSDARFVCRGKYVDADMCLEFFPQAKKIIATKSTGPFSVDSTAIPGTQDQEWYDQQRDRVYLIEIQYKEFEKTDCFWDGFQLTKYIPSVHDPLLNEKFGRIVNTKIIVVKQAFILNDYIIFEQDLPYLFNNFTFVPFVAQRDSQGNPLSLVRYLKDMQDEINKRRSKVLHYLTAKRVLAEEGAVADVNEFMEELGHPDAFLQYRKGYEIKVEQDLEIGAQHFQLMHEAADEISQISGIYPDFQGMPTNARTGEAIRQRVVQSQTATQRYFSAVERGLQTIAENCIALARQYYTTERLIQLTDEPYAIVLNEPVPTEDGRIQIRNSLAKLRADVVVKVEPGNQTERQQQLIQLTEIFKSLPPELSIMYLDILFDAFDIPQKTEMKRRFEQMMQAQAQAQAQSQPQVQVNKG